MNNNLDVLWGKWTIQNMNDDHFYRMSTWSDQQESTFIKRILQAIRKEFTILQCRIKALTFAPNLSMDQQCEGLEV